MRVYQPNELESVGSLIRRALDASGDSHFYRPTTRPIPSPNRALTFNRKRNRSVRPAGGAAVDGQMSFKFPEYVRDSVRPLIDLFPEAYK